ncbi:MAG: hypothetical protein U1A27_02230 [Phycisphaerae bacterium]
MPRNDNRVSIILQLLVLLCALCLSYRVALADEPLVYESGVIEGLASDPVVISELPTITVALDNKFILAWTTRYDGSLRGLVVRRFDDDGSALDNAPVPVATSQPQHKWYDPSLAIEQVASPSFRLAFSGYKEPHDQQNRVERVFILDYPFPNSPFAPPVAVGQAGHGRDARATRRSRCHAIHGLKARATQEPQARDSEGP